MEIKEFNKLPLLKFFQHDVEAIMMAFRLSDSIRGPMKNTRSAGDTVELAVKDFFARKLFPKYHVSSGHMVDSGLTVSSQCDVIISENSKNPVLFQLPDKSELVYFDTTFCFGEVKRSFYDNELLNDFSNNIERIRKGMNRAIIEPNFLESGSAGIHLESALTAFPQRNPLFSFMIFIDSSKASSSKLRNTFLTRENKNLPNFVVFLDRGIILNFDERSLEMRRPVINLYPEFASEPNVWRMIDLKDRDKTLMYQFMLIVEHLNSSVVAAPNINGYIDQLFSVPLTDYYPL